MRDNLRHYCKCEKLSNRYNLKREINSKHDKSVLIIGLLMVNENLRKSDDNFLFFTYNDK